MIKFLRVRKWVEMPKRWTATSSGIDFFVPPLSEIKDDIKFTPLVWMDQLICKEHFLNDDRNSITIPKHKGVMIPSWFKVRLPKGDLNTTYEMSMHNKSWIAVKIWLVVGAQIIDNDYTWEFNLHLINTSDSPKVIECWQKIVQGIVRKVSLNKIGTISEEEFNKFESERGEGWFGSTGV